MVWTPDNHNLDEFDWVYRAGSSLVAATPVELIPPDVASKVAIDYAMISDPSFGGTPVLIAAPSAATVTTNGILIIAPFVPWQANILLEQGYGVYAYSLTAIASYDASVQYKQLPANNI